MADLPKVLIIGSGGLVGANLYSRFKAQGYQVAGADVIKNNTADYQADITDGDALDKIFIAVKPQVVVLAAALTNVDLCEADEELAKKINIEGTKSVVKFCRQYRSKLVFFSSEYVFDGKSGPYGEEDKPAPINFYGHTKLEGERIIAAGLPDYLIIRSTVIYGKEEQQKNFAIRFIKSLRQGQAIKVPVDQIGSPTYAANLVQVVEELIRKNKGGIYNVVGADVMSRYDFAKEICEAFELDIELVIPVTTAELRQAAQRPLKAGLRIDKVSREVEVKILGVRESLQLFKKEIDG
jgi:dTDP-4-dehydrorhamnose reductase